MSKPLLCRLFHKGQWTYISEEACDMIHVCQRCGLERKQTVHRKKLKSRTEECEGIRCVCGERLGRGGHTWEKTTFQGDEIGERYIGSGIYTVVYEELEGRICRHCGETEY